jgi:enterochelin esterase-like enzyme
MRKLLLCVPLILALIVALPARSAGNCPEGVVLRDKYYSKIAVSNMLYSVYLPPCYDQQPNQHYPVVYLLHGSASNDTHWLNLGLKKVLDDGMSAGTLPSMIVALPYGNWIANKNQFEDQSFENVMLKEFIPLVESTYRVDARRETRAIGGISRGGFWAFEIALRHPDMFSAVGGHSAFFDPGHAPKAYNPLNLATDAPGIDALRIWLDRGKDDYARKYLDRMHDNLKARGIAHTYQLYPVGQHADSYWRQHVAEYMAFYAQDWKAGTSAIQATSTPMVFATNTPIAPTNQPSATPTIEPQAAEEGLSVFLPVVAFASLRANIPPEQLVAIRSGQSVANLVLDETTAAALQKFGVSLAADVRTVPDAGLFNALWSDRRLFTLLAFDRLTTRYRVLHLNSLHPLDTDLSVYPFTFPDNPGNYQRGKLTRILLSGVTALTRLTRVELDTKGVEWAGEAIKPYVDRADYFHTSNEVSFYEACPRRPASDAPGTFCSKQEHFKLLTDLGLDIVELTGNHNLDFGQDVYLKTLDFYKKNNIQTLGGGANLEQARRPLLIQHNGSKIAMLACNWIGPYYALAKEAAPGAAFCELDWLKTELPALSRDNDLVIVTVQYQEFEQYTPTPKQKSDFQLLADLGADVVIGTQAHKPQTFEFYSASTGKQAFIHYGLGNLFFDQPFWGNSRFFMDELYIYEGRLLNVDLFTGIIEDNARPRPMTDDEAHNFLAFMFNTQGNF